MHKQVESDFILMQGSRFHHGPGLVA